MNNPLSMLRHHVTGAIERGESAPIVEVKPATVYLYRQGDGNDGNYPMCVVHLAPTDNPWAFCAAMLANRYIPGCRTRRHVMRAVETDGEREYGVSATVYYGPDGEQPYESAWLTAELQPLDEKDADFYSGRYTEHLSPRDALDSAAWRFYRKECKK